MTQRSEAVRGIVRIASNYLRLASTFLIGIFFVKLALGFGTDAYGLIVLIGVGTGILGMIDEVVNWSMIRELGAAYHGARETRFRSVFTSAFVVCLGAALLTLAAFGLVLLVLDWLEIPVYLLPAARWFLVCTAIQAAFRVVLAPARNMYVISERMVAMNVWEVVPRLLDLCAVALTLAWADPNPADQVICYGVLSNLFAVAQLAVSAVLIYWIDPKLRLAPRLVSRRQMASLVKTGGWNTSISLAMNLGNRTDAIIMNKFFGTNGNVIYGLGLQTSAYARMIAQGVTVGVDALATRVSTVSGVSAIRELINYMTRLHGAVAFPAGLGCFFLVEPFLHAWVGRNLKDPATQIPQIVAITRILIVAITIRSISDGWTRVLYGAGYIRTYAPLIFLGSLFNPFLSVALLWMYPDWYTAPSWAHTGLFFVFHVLLLPWLIRYAVQIGIRDTIFPLFRPVVASVICVPILVWGCLHLQPGDLRGLAIVVLAYGASYLPVAWLVILDSGERQRVLTALRRRLPGMSPGG
ncbi:MAG: hypothetical protein JNG90_15145 [Planctomycetaceae bacterium]|nr:hypothetical protein [Planctomycetaceae bacterium]